MSSERIIAIDARDALIAEVYRLRFEVFVDEQGVPREIELDAEDDSAIHLAAIRDGEVVGTLRLLQHDGTAKIGRVAVRATLRNSGIGRRLMNHGAAIASQKGFAEIVLHAQVTVAGFYRRLGYVAEGDVFDEAGIPHIAMRKRLAP
jgi:predicted GNAT family N-acyltransferase